MRHNYTLVKYHVEDSIAKITLNSPEKMNAFEVALMNDLICAMNEAAEDPTVKVVVLTGAGKAFCAGGDVSHMKTLDLEGAYDYIKNGKKLVDSMTLMSKPIIAAVNGFAVGAGLSLALLSDIVISSDKAMFGAAFINIGLMPDCGLLYYLPRVVGLRAAKELTLTGRNFDPQEALRLGIVNQVVEADKLEETVEKLSKKMASGPAAAMAFTKSVMNSGLDMNIDGLMNNEALAQAMLIVSADAQEGADAFLAKRKAKFASPAKSLLTSILACLK
jgi:2-(1,2-epoxy-1,2-dihydrophenyl)acetyl-CoA isomerase